MRGWTEGELSAMFVLPGVSVVHVAVLLVISSLVWSASESARFRDVSKAAGLKQKERLVKYGGAAVADLDGDGWPDLILGNHVEAMELYFNRRDGTFEKSSFKLKADLHGVSPFRMTPRDRSMYFSVSRGGASNTRLNSPYLFRVLPKRFIQDVTGKSRLRAAKGRGRNIVPMRLGRSSNKYIDVVVMNAQNRGGKPRHNFLLSGFTRGKFWKRPIPRSLAVQDKNWWGATADVNNDGRMELITFNNDLQAYKLSSYWLRPITNAVFPRDIELRGIAAVAQLDFDNDGRMDLYLARSTLNHGVDYLRRVIDVPNDYLLRNVGGRYVDVSREGRIPMRTQSSGVTTGDFNNDGWIDILVNRANKQDLLLLNKGDGTFRTRSAGFRRKPFISGDMSTAVDYDRDGRLDVILSEGHYSRAKNGGFYRIMRNVGPRRNYLLVRVGSSPSGRVTSLHAVVRVFAVGLRMMRQVGSPGTAISISYIELMHFGLGRRKRAAVVKVTWSDGTVRRRYNVAANRIIKFGTV